MYDFMKYKPVWFALSLLIIIPSIYSLATFGLKPGIDFSGGSLYEVSSSLTAQELEQQLNEAISAQELLTGLEVVSVQVSGQSRLLVKMNALTEPQRQVLTEHLRASGSLNEVLRFESVGPSVGRELLQKTLLAVVIASFAILSYVALAFKKLTFGVAALLAMLHDTLILIGVFSLLGKYYGIEIDVLFVAAVLTILSFSVHDTVVVFDRIRETIKLGKYGSDFTKVCNVAVGETLVRSLNNSLTIIFMLLALAILGGDSIRWFVVALLVGTVVGTYSSTFTAVPILHFLITKHRSSG